MMLGLYRGLGRLIAPGLDLVLDRRLQQGKEDSVRLPERRGHASVPRPPGRLVWLHAASVGEAISVLAVVERLLDDRPGLSALITTGTVTSATLLADRLPQRAVHQYVPLDHLPWVRRFLDHWRPDLAVWVESELWPNLLDETRRRSIPMVLVNARLSERSLRRWRLLPGVFRALVGGFSAVLALDESQAERFRGLGIADVEPVGNLKLAAPRLPVEEPARAALAAAIGERARWLAASTHAGEDEAVIAAHLRAERRYPDLLTIIAPRHPARGEQIARLVREAGLAVVRRSERCLPDARTAVYVADTMGELGTLFAVVDLAFVGGSLVSKGGHNPVEPAHFGCALLHGPDMVNTGEVARHLADAGASLTVRDGDALAAALVRLLGDRAERRRMGEAARAVAAAHLGILDRVVARLAPWLDGPEEPASGTASRAGRAGA